MTWICNSPRTNHNFQFAFADRVALTVIGSTTDMTTTETVRFEPGFVAIVTGDFLFIPLVCFNTGFFQHALLVVPDVHAVTVTPHRPIGMSGLDLLLKPFVVMAANSCSSAPAGAKIRVENLHYDITESDLEVNADQRAYDTSCLIS